MADNVIRTDSAEGKSLAWVIVLVVVVCIVSLAGLGMAWKATTFAQESRQALNNDMQTMKQTYDTNLNTLGGRLAKAEKTNANLEDDLSVVVKRLQITRGELQKAREEAQQIRDEQNQQLSAMDTEMKGQLATKASNDDVKQVSGEVTGVRTDLDTTKKDLQMARSEMGTLIAKNHDDIEVLRRLGERDYFEFTIAERNKSERVAGIAIELRGTDPKKNQCNLALVVNDKRTEKRNRTINEPIFFYVHGEHQASEIVINKVAKNQVAGYVSVPKVTQPAATAGAGN